MYNTQKNEKLWQWSCSFTFDVGSKGSRASLLGQLVLAQMTLPPLTRVGGV
jgi:hypothetical protein